MRPLCSFAASWEALHILVLLGMNTSINWKMGWVLLRCWCSCANVLKTVHVLGESADACISTMAFNAIVAKLFWFVEVTGSNANNANAWREAVSVEDAWTFTAREWTQHDNSELRLEWIVEKGKQADENCCVLLALTYWIESKACWELAALVAFGDLRMISSSYCTGWLEGNSGVCFVERTLRSSAFHSNLWFVVWPSRLMIESKFASQFCLFVSLNQIIWFSQIWSPATWFRLRNAFT